MYVYNCTTLTQHSLKLFASFWSKAVLKFKELQCILYTPRAPCHDLYMSGLYTRQICSTYEAIVPMLTRFQHRVTLYAINSEDWYGSSVLKVAVEYIGHHYKSISH